MIEGSADKSNIPLDPKAESIQHVAKLFSMRLSNPSPAFIPQFSAIIPQYNKNVFSKKKLTLDLLLDELRIRPINRVGFLIYILDNFLTLTQSQSQVENLYVYILQSFTCLYFHDITKFPDEYLNAFFDSLVIANKILPEGKDLVSRTFFYFYEIVVSTPHIIRLLPFINNLYETMKTPSYFLPTHLEFVKNIIEIQMTNPEIQTNKDAVEIFDKIVLQLGEKQKGKLSQQYISNIYDEIFKSFSLNPSDINSFRALLLSLGLELSRLTGFKFNKIESLIKTIINMQPTELGITIQSSDSPKIPVSLPAFKQPQEYIETYPQHLYSILRFFQIITPEQAAEAMRCLTDAFSTFKSFDYQRFVFTLLYFKVFRQPPMNTFLEGFEVGTIFFDPSLFDSRYSIFTKPTPFPVLVRAFAVRVFKSRFGYADGRVVANNVIPLLIYSMPVAHQFAEVLYFIKDIILFSKLSKDIQQNFIKCITFGIEKFISETKRLENMKNNYENQEQQNIEQIDNVEERKIIEFDKKEYKLFCASRALTQSVLIDMCKDNAFVTSALEDPDFIKANFDLMMNPKSLVDAAVLASNLFTFAVSNFESLNLDPLFNTLGSMFRHITNTQDRSPAIGSNLITIIHTALITASDEFLLFMYHHDLYKAIESYIYSMRAGNFLESQKDVISGVLSTALLILYAFSLAMMREVLVIDWEPLADVISSFGVTPEIYTVILMILSSNQQQFTGINNIHVCPLVKPILQSPMIVDFLAGLLAILAHSEVQCVNCAKAGLHLMLLDKIKESKDSEITHIITPVLYEMSTVICDRKSLFSFIRMVDPAIADHQYSRDMLQFMFNSTSKRPSKRHNFLQFTAIHGSINLPPITNADFVQQFTISVYVLLSGFTNTPDMVQILNIASPIDHLVFALSISEMTIYSSIFPGKIPLTIPICFPVNQWFNLTIAISALSVFSVYVDGMLSGRIETSCNRWDEPPDQIMLFHPMKTFNKVKSSSVEGQVSEICVMNSAPNDKLLEAFVNHSEDFSEILSYPKIIMLYSANMTKDGELINLVEGPNARFNMYIYTNVYPIRYVFEGSRGISMIIAMLSRIDYKAEDSGKMFLSILQAIGSFMSSSREIAEQMLRVNCFSTVAYFMENLEHKHFTPKLIDCIFRLEKEIMGHPQRIENDDVLHELLVSYYQHMLFEFPVWFELDLDIIARILNKWNSIARTHSSIFMENVSFTSLIDVCHQLIANQKFDSRISTEILSIMLLSAQNCCTIQTVGLLVRLLEYVKTDDQFSIKVLHILYTLAVDIEDMAGQIRDLVVSNKQQIIHNSPQVFIVLMTLFANTQVTYTDCIVFFLAQCVDTETVEKVDYIAKIACNEVVSSDKIFEIEELCKRKLTTVVPSLIPLCLISTFYNSKETSDQVCKFIKCIFENTSMLRKIANECSCLMLFFMLTFAIIKFPDFIFSLVTLFSLNTQLLADAFMLIDIISRYTNTDHHYFQNAIASALVMVVQERNDAEEIAKFVDIMTNFLFFGSERAIFEPHHQSDSVAQFNLFRFIETLRAAPVGRKPFTSGIYLADEHWDDLNIAVLLVQMLTKIPKNIKSVRQLIVVLSNILRADPGYAAQMVPLLNIIAEQTEATVSDLYPLIYVISINPDSYRAATSFFAKFEYLIVQSCDTFNQACNTMSLFCANLRQTSTVENELRGIFESHVQMPRIESMPLESTIPLIRKGLLSRRGTAKKKWSALWEQLEEDLTPFFNPSQIKRYFVRSDRFDSHFRPILYKKSRVGPPELKGMRGEFNISEFFKEGTGPLFIGSTPGELWSAPCQRISVGKITDGIFYVTANRIVFQDEAKASVIRGDSVECVFWRWTYHKPDSVAIFTDDFRGYLFRFPGQRSHAFTKNLKKMAMPKCTFFQEHPASVEIERLGLTQRWRTRSISNYAYLTWLNMFAGRSFLDVHAYPIFPWVLIGEGKPNRDLSKNMGVISKNFAQYKRAKQDTAFDRYDIELFDHAFLTSADVLHYNARVEPFTSLYAAVDADKPEDSFKSIENEIEKLQNNDPSLTELTPEFFFSPEFLEKSAAMDSVQLPNYVRSAAEFIYTNKRALESEYVSNNLHQWIDLVWGVKQRYGGASVANNQTDFRLYDTVWQSTLEPHRNIEELLVRKGEIPQKLFDGDHPRRLKFGVSSSINHEMIVITNIESKVNAMCIYGKTYDKLRIHVLLNSGKFVCVRIGASSFEVDMPRLPKFMHPCAPDAITAFLLGERPSFGYTNGYANGVSVFDHDSHSIFGEEASPHIEPITCLADCKDTIISGGRSGEIAQWKVCARERMTKAVCYSLITDKPVVCVAASYKIGIVISIDAANDMRISTIPGLRFLRARHIDAPDGFRPVKIIVAEEMGYIIVAFRGRGQTILMNFTVNAAPITQIRLPEEVVDVIAYIAPAYLDVVAVITDQPGIKLLDGFTFESVRRLNFGYRFTHVCYHPETGNLVASTTENAILAIPTFFL